ncbi:adenylate kinase [Alistipes indistinctus]|jgi:adenylate kinase|uniref:adenylate kinase n=1 Tax=Alistipes indistinctus TaxID=626932 RepID=UPI00242F0677|nr:adenylate kinase [Alistipes indistinctus]MBS1439890.1 adenylate kinase [Alistipes sp.]
MFNLVLFGPPGAGKGTQAEKLIEKYGFNHISTGEVIREQIRKGTELGRSVQSYIEKGQLAPDGLVIDIIADYVAKHKDAKGNIFDGFPRTTVQAKAFDEIMEKNSTPVSVMLSLEVPDEELVKRLLLRGKESGRADDSNEGVIRDRIDVYKAQTAVVADHYKPQGKHRAVNGLGTIDEIFGRLCQEIESLNK